jgi:hypothetical protein
MVVSSVINNWSSMSFVRHAMRLLLFGEYCFLLAATLGAIHMRDTVPPSGRVQTATFSGAVLLTSLVRISAFPTYHLWRSGVRSRILITVGGYVTVCTSLGQTVSDTKHPHLHGHVEHFTSFVFDRNATIALPATPMIHLWYTFFFCSMAAVSISIASIKMRFVGFEMKRRP